jgi:hypothetical protein
VLGHELVHAFQFDMLPGPGASSGASLPLWFIEGLAEYLSLGPVDPHTTMWLRDAAQRNDLPTVRRLNHPRYFPYRWGHAFWAYIGGRYGDQAVGRMMRIGARSGVDAAIRQVLNTDSDTLSQEWHAAVTAKVQPVLGMTTPVRQP